MNNILLEKSVSHQVRNFERLMDEYEGKEPFSRFLSSFYKVNKQMGSRDRRMTTRLAYNYFRLGKAAMQLSQLKRLVLAEFLCESSSDLVTYYRPDLADKMMLPVGEKLRLLTGDQVILLEDIFPQISSLMPEIDSFEFICSHFIQPNLFIRIKKGKATFVKAVFEQAQLPFTELSDTTFSLTNGVSLQQFTNLKGVIEVQDLSSQRTIEFMHAHPSAKELWWDACAASGGKSLLFLDHFPQVDLLVSDLRMSILRNLDERFDSAGIKQYRKKIIDLSKDASPVLGDLLFDGILLDVPCTGSGTWGRNPEHLKYFDTRKIAEFAQLQKLIASHVVPFLKKGAELTYMTCSVYQEENAQVIKYLMEHLGMECLESKVLCGYHEKADSMFAARLKRI